MNKLNEKNYKEPSKLYQLEKDIAFWPADSEDWLWWSSEADEWAENYAKSYRVKISPYDFLDLTTEKGASNLKYGDMFLGGELRDLDIDEFNKEKHQPIFLQIAFRDESRPKLAQVVGHEGRHRMFALMKAGIKQVDIELRCDVYDTNYNKYKPFKLDYIMLRGQFNPNRIVTVRNPIPMSWKTHKEMRPGLKEEYSCNGVNFEFTWEQLYNILSKELKGLSKTLSIVHLQFIFPDLRQTVVLELYNKINSHPLTSNNIDKEWWSNFTNLVNGEDSDYAIELKELDPEILEKELHLDQEDVYLESKLKEAFTALPIEDYKNPGKQVFDGVIIPNGTIGIIDDVAAQFDADGGDIYFTDLHPLIIIHRRPTKEQYKTLEEVTRKHLHYADYTKIHLGDNYDYIIFEKYDKALEDDTGEKSSKYKDVRVDENGWKGWEITNAIEQYFDDKEVDDDVYLESFWNYSDGYVDEEPYEVFNVYTSPENVNKGFVAKEFLNKDNAIKYCKDNSYYCVERAYGYDISTKYELVYINTNDDVYLESHQQLNKLHEDWYISNEELYEILKAGVNSFDNKEDAIRKYLVKVFPRVASKYSENMNVISVESDAFDMLYDYLKSGKELTSRYERGNWFQNYPRRGIDFNALRAFDDDVYLENLKESSLVLYKVYPTEEDYRKRNFISMFGNKEEAIRFCQEKGYYCVEKRTGTPRDPEEEVLYKDEDVFLEKIVKQGSKWQVQSEKGKNLGAYDTEDEAKKRLKQVHYFKNINEAKEISDDELEHILRDAINSFDTKEEAITEYLMKVFPAVQTFRRKGFEKYAGTLDSFDLLYDYLKYGKTPDMGSWLTADWHKGYNRRNIDFDALYNFEDKSNVYLENLDESLLLEKTRNQLIDKSKKSDKYKTKGRENENRWTRRTKSRIANTVKDYNKIDMDAFFKADILDFIIKVHGETDEYEVTITFEEALREIADQIKRNNNKLEFKCVLRGLISAFNRGNVYVGCSCPDFKYRQQYWATKGQYNSIFPQPSNGKRIANPDDTKGAGCKHVNLCLANLDWMMKIASVINNYIYWARDNIEMQYAKFMFPVLYGMPYDKAIQMTFDMYDENGELKPEYKDGKLQSEQDVINMSNMLGARRTQYKKKPERSVNPRYRRPTVKPEEPEDNELGLEFDNEEPELDIDNI